jgi:ADP-ribosylglycohydrolase
VLVTAERDHLRHQTVEAGVLCNELFERFAVTSQTIRVSERLAEKLLETLLPPEQVPDHVTRIEHRSSTDRRFCGFATTHETSVCCPSVAESGQRSAVEFTRFARRPRMADEFTQRSLFDEPEPATSSDNESVSEVEPQLPPSPMRFDPLAVSTVSMNLGAVLGGAIGDAMGHPTEFVGSFERIFAKYPPNGVTKFELYWERNGHRFAPYTDDTQMAEIVLRSLLEGGDLDTTMTRMARGFVDWAERPQGGHRAPGNACLAGCRALARGVPWRDAGGPTAGGCGSVMRAYPFGLVFANDVAKAETWAVEHSKLTHRDPIALAASAAMAVGMALIRQRKSITIVTSEMVAAACRYSARTAAMMATALEDALIGIEPTTTLQRLQAWAAHEAIAAAVYIFTRHPNNPVAAILEGANTPGDSDSIATLAGALVGARCGIEAFPTSWVAEVERSQELSDLAKRIPQDS